MNEIVDSLGDFYNENDRNEGAMEWLLVRIHEDKNIQCYFGGEI